MLTLHPALGQVNACDLWLRTPALLALVIGHPAGFIVVGAAIVDTLVGADGAARSQEKHRVRARCILTGEGVASNNVILQARMINNYTNMKILFIEGFV